VASIRCRWSWRRARASSDFAAYGPALSSARVRAEIASSAGNLEGSSCSREIATEVSISPRSLVGPATRSGVLVDVPVDVFAELLGIDRADAPERRLKDAGRDELPGSDRSQFAHGDTVAGDEELLTAIQLSHDLSTLVAQLALGDGVPSELM